MSDVFWTALFASLPATIAAVIAGLIAWRASAKIDQQAVRLEEVHKATNGMSARLEAQSRAEGFTAGQIDQQATNRDAAVIGQLVEKLAEKPPLPPP